MKKITKYFLIWLISSLLLLVALSINNMFWVTGSPEWDSVFIVSNSIEYWVGPVKEYSSGELFYYLIFYRVYTVWSNLRDIISAVLVGFIVVTLTFFYDKVKEKREREHYA